MHYRRLGRSGLKVSEISLGSWLTFGEMIDQETISALILAAYDHGVNLFDCADVYANGTAEEYLGVAIKHLPREALVISSKVFFPTMPGPNGRGLSRKHITESIHASLKRLGTDYIDLYFCHRYDPDTPLLEVIHMMNTLIQQGKILYWGTSEWTPAQISRAYGLADNNNLIPPVVEQPQYNMFVRSKVEIELSPLCKDLGIGLTTWAPLLFGILTGKYADGIPEDSRAAREGNTWVMDHFPPERQEKVRDLGIIARDLEITQAQLSLAWLLRRKEVSSVITGATKVDHINENIGAADAVSKLNDTVIDHIEVILDNIPA